MVRLDILQLYGHIPMEYMEENGLYYFQTANQYQKQIIIATVHMPNLLTPQTTLPLILFDEVNIVGVYMNNILSIYDLTYIKPLEEMFIK